MINKTFMFILCMVLLMTTITAWDWDNTKNYDTSTRTATITNTFGLGSTIARATLETPDLVNVGLGEQNIANITLTKEDNYDNLISEMKFYNARNNKELQRDYVLKYWVTKTISVNDYKTIPSTNGTSTQSVIGGTHQKEVGEWVNFKDSDLKLTEAKLIGVFVNVRNGDYVEWIPKIAGVNIDEWAFYNATIDVGIVAYYPTNQSSGTNLVDYLGFDDNGTIANSPTWGTNKITYNGINQYVNLTNLEHSLNATSEMSIAFTFSPNNYSAIPQYLLANWFNGVGGSNYWFQTISGKVHSFVSSSGGKGICNDGGSGTDINTNMNITEGNTYIVVATINTTGAFYWINNGTTTETTSIACLSSGLFWDNGGDVSTISRRPFTQTSFFNGTIGINTYWNRSLDSTEALFVISILGRESATYVTLNSPVDNYNSTSQIINFNGSVLSETDIANVSLIVDEIYTDTNTSGINNTNYLFTETISDGGHNWTMELCDISAICLNGTERNFYVDTTFPQHNITSPIDSSTYTFLSYGDVLYFNNTVSDTNLSACWYDYNNTNTSYSCATGIQQNETFSITNQSSIIGYANDTSGNTNSSSISWNYNLFDFLNYTYDSSINLLTPTTFTGQFQTGSTVSSAYLEYNNTNYSATINSLGGNIYYLSKTVTSPSISAQTNVSWNFWVNNVNTSSYNQTIIPYSIDNCTNNTIQIFNFTLYDEDTQAFLVGADANTSMKLNLNLYADPDLTTLVSQYYHFYNQTNPARVCINDSLTSSNTYISAKIEYVASDYADEFYNIQAYKLNGTSNPSENISLYDLLSANNQIFVITYKDSSYIPISDAIIQIKREYVDQGVSKTIEQPITDTSGQTVGNLVLNTVIYDFTVTKNGQILSTFNNYFAKCQNPLIQTCEIDLNAYSSSTPITNYTSSADFLYDLTYDNSTRTITGTFNIPSGATSLVYLNVTTEDALGTEACSQSVISSSGSISCIVPTTFGNSTVRASFYKENVLIGGGNINLDQSPGQLYGGILIVLSLFIFITLIGASMSDNPIYTIFFFLIGVILLFALNLVGHNGFIGGTASILFLIIAIIIIVIKAGRRN